MTQFLTFNLNQSEFGININQACEVLEYRDFTPLPNMPDYILGMISLRGNAVPVMDLKQRLNLVGSGVTKETSIIILDSNLKSKMGILVDSVNEVVDLENKPIQEPPKTSLNEDVSGDFIHGLVEHRAGKYLLLLEIMNIFELQPMKQREIDEHKTMASENSPMLEDMVE